MVRQCTHTGFHSQSGQSEEVKAIYSEQSEHLRQETPGKDMNFEHRALDWETFEICLPWKYVAGSGTKI